MFTAEVSMKDSGLLSPITAPILDPQFQQYSCSDKVKNGRHPSEGNVEGYNVVALWAKAKVFGKPSIDFRHRVCD